jgi:zinc D-Ala-D-Ala carboxypeptidase
MPAVGLQLTHHFSLAEMTATQHRGFNNTPDKLVFDNLKRTAELLEVVRAALGFPIYVTSGYRCPALNAAVGGVANSQHMTGQAADFIIPAFGQPREVWAAIRDALPEIQFDQLIYEHPSQPAWCHISWSPTPRRQAFELGNA